MVMTAEQLKNHFEDALTNLHSVLSTQKTEISTLGQTTSATATKITELENSLTELHGEFVEFARAGAIPGGERNGAKRQSIGDAFISSNQYKNMIDMKMQISAPFQVNSLFPASRYALTSDGATGAAVAAVPDRLPGFINPTMPTLRMRDLIPVRGTTQGSIEFVRTTGFFPVYTTLDAGIAAGVTALSVVSVAGFSAGQPILVGTESHTVVAVDDAGQNLTVSPATTLAYVVGDRVVSRVVAATGQGKTKPTGEFTDFSLENEPVKTVATSVDVARQALDDIGQLRAFIDNQLMFEMAYTEEWNLLYGDGSAQQLHGILTDPDRQTYNWSDGKVQDIGGTMIADTKIDTLRRAITMVQLARYPADGVVINPRDWEDFELMKGSDGHYIWLQLPNGYAGNSFFQYPVVVTDAISQGTALTGAFKLGTALWDRELANIRASDQHGTNFKQNLVSLLAEERIAQTVFRPEAFVEITFDAPPT
jgi:HK97 family phage major capsid protein